MVGCYKCLRHYEIHGFHGHLELALEAEGWREDRGKNVCPRCLVHRELPAYNKAKQERKYQMRHPGSAMLEHQDWS